MSFNDWLSMCPHSVVIEPYVSMDLYGNPTYGAGVTYRARVQGKNQMVMSLTGEEVVSRVTIYMQHANVSVQDRITLPAIFQPTQPKIIDVRKVSDEQQQHHLAVYC